MFAEQIKALRRWYRYSQADFGDLAGVTRQAVAKWEKGESVPDVLTVKKIADKLGLSMEDVVRFHERGVKAVPGGKERYMFGEIKMGRNGTIRLPKEVCEAMNMKVGDELFVLGDIERGVELLPMDQCWKRLFNKYMA